MIVPTGCTASYRMIFSSNWPDDFSYVTRSRFKKPTLNQDARKFCQVTSSNNVNKLLSHETEFIITPPPYSHIL